MSRTTQVGEFGLTHIPLWIHTGTVPLVPDGSVPFSVVEICIEVPLSAKTRTWMTQRVLLYPYRTIANRDSFSINSNLGCLWYPRIVNILRWNRHEVSMTRRTWGEAWGNACWETDDRCKEMPLSSAAIRRIPCRALSLAVDDSVYNIILVGLLRVIALRT